eukprot:GHVL01019880.1.p1 GENE.GHVL01019880.1~~GHVL01019880.1.p1  ORF type:complete len:825 (-),score=157.52 GHVL01019880.1:38-2512(-)
MFAIFFIFITSVTCSSIVTQGGKTCSDLYNTIGCSFDGNPTCEIVNQRSTPIYDICNCPKITILMEDDDFSEIPPFWVFFPSTESAQIYETLGDDDSKFYLYSSNGWFIDNDKNPQNGYLLGAVNGLYNSGTKFIYKSTGSTLSARAIFCTLTNQFDVKANDSCNSNNGGCDPHAICSSVDGIVKCVCISGYIGDGIRCDDINPCSKNNGGCSPNGVCVNSLGVDTRCYCPNGYIGDGYICNDINECLIDNGGCDVLSKCINNQGGAPTCTCPDGFQEDIPFDANNGCILNRQSCIDIDECLNEVCGEKSKCINTTGSYICKCIAGYSQVKSDCIDLDECALSLDTCGANSECINTEGSFFCDCLPGYSGDGTSCVDVDECVDVNFCAGGGLCVNQMGAPAQCYGVSADALPSDACKTNNGGCDVNAQCISTGLDVTCRCNPGLQQTQPVTNTLKEGKLCLTQKQICEDILECSIFNGGCDENALCVENYGGPPTCLCKEGMPGNGVVCCPKEGWEVGDDGLCFHVDELVVCPVNTDPDPVNGYCVPSAVPTPEFDLPAPDIQPTTQPYIEPYIEQPQEPTVEYYVPEYTAMCPEGFAYAFGECVPIWEQPDANTVTKQGTCAHVVCPPNETCFELIGGPRCQRHFRLPSLSIGIKGKGRSIQPPYIPPIHPPIPFKISWEPRGSRRWFLDCGHDISLAGFGRHHRWFSVFHFLKPGVMMGGMASSAPMGAETGMWKPYSYHCNVYPKSSPFSCEKQPTTYPVPSQYIDSKSGKYESTISATGQVTSSKSSLKVFRVNPKDVFKSDPCNSGFKYSPPKGMCYAV